VGSALFLPSGQHDLSRVGEASRKHFSTRFGGSRSQSHFLNFFLLSFVTVHVSPRPFPEGQRAVCQQAYQFGVSFQTAPFLSGALAIFFLLNTVWPRGFPVLAFSSRRNGLINRLSLFSKTLLRIFL